MRKKDFILFLLANAFLGISQSIDGSFFNNFLSDIYHLTTTQRTLLEVPREFPGFIVVLIAGLFLFLGDVRTAAIANILAAIGIFSIGFFNPSYGAMIGWLMLFSMGQHLFMPISNSIGMDMAGTGNFGRKLGQISAANTAAFLVVSLITAFVFKNIKVNFRVAFTIEAVAYIASAIMILFMTPIKKKVDGPKVKVKKFIIRREYKLFYILNFLYGARKQIFITFGPWVLIKVFYQGVSTFAILGFVIAGIGIFFKPLLGFLIDKKGERFVLAGEAILLIIICLGYAYSSKVMKAIGRGDLAVFIVCVCYIVDQLLNAVGMARATYLKKIALHPEDVSPTLAMGTSMDHAVSMIVPFIGGVVWTIFGYEYVFIGGACIAILNLIATRYMKITIQENKKESTLVI